MRRACVLTLAMALAVAAAAKGQVSFDGSLGPAGPAPTRTDLPGYDLDYLIRYDERDATPQGVRAGNNLFQSLSELSIPQPAGLQTSATFQALDVTGAPLALDNVIARVTGGQPSVIEGVLRSEVPGANLYLLNPAGVLFRGGGLATRDQLDVPASFYASTADQLHFTDGTVFEVSALAAPTLSMSEPAAFGFLGGGDGTVRLEDRALLRTPTGSSITFAAAGVEITGESTVEVPGGTAQVAASGGAEVVVPLTVSDWATRDAAPGTLGEIAITVDSRIRQTVNTSADPQSRIVLRGGRLVVDDSLVSAGGIEGVAGNALDAELADEIVARNNSRLQVNSFIDAGAGTGRLVSRRIEVRDPGTQVRVLTSGVAAAAPFVVTADEVLVTDGGVLGTENRSTAPGGTLDLDAGLLEVRDGGIVQSASILSSESGGLLDLVADRITVTRSDSAAEGGAIRSISLFGGRGGDIQLDTGEGAISVDAGGQISATSGVSGDGGDVQLTTGSLAIAGGGQIRTNTISDRDAGDIEVVASGMVTIAGDGPDPDQPSGLFARSGTGIEEVGAGAAGDIRVTADSLSMSDNAVISTRSYGSGEAGGVALSLAGGLSVANRAEISARTFDAASGGVDIDAAGVLLADGAAVSSATLGSGTAGDVAIRAQQVTLDGVETEILSESSDSLNADAGDAGTIQITAGDTVQLLDGARISVLSRGAGAAGDVQISAGNRVLLQNAEITTEAVSQINEASGGNIEITAPERVELVESALRTSVRGSVGSGDAGNITIDPRFVVVNDSQILAQAVLGNGGNIRIVAENFLQSAGSLVDASSQLGVDGTVVVEGPENDLKDELARLPDRYLDATALLREQCAARVAGSGSFIVAGSEGVAAAPDEPLPGWMPLPQASAAAAATPGRIEAARRLRGTGAPAFDCAALARATEVDRDAR